MSLFKAGVHRMALSAAVTIALMLGVVIGCTGSPGQTSGAQGPGSGPKDFPNDLMEVLTKLVTNDIPKQADLAVKYLLLSNALANLDFSATGKTSVEKLIKADDFIQTETKKPLYFDKPFNGHPVVAVTPKAGYYDYKTSHGTWVDYAAVNLGGGVFHNGFKQEETMALEMPELANTVAQGEHFTRSPGCEPSKPKVLLCNPRPLMIGPVHRTIDIDPKLANEWDQASFHRDKAFGYVHPLSHNVELNVLAIAVSSLEGVKDEKTEQSAQNTIDDLFNTFVAGFTLAKEQKVTELNTGGIGTGVFRNSTKVVYVMQKLAATHVGLKALTYYGIDQNVPKQKDELKDWDAAADKITSSYDTSATKTVRHLLELAHQILK